MPKASRNSGTAKGYYNNEDILTFSKRVLMPPATMDLPDPLVPIFVYVIFPPSVANCLK